MPGPEQINQSVPLPEEKIGWVIGKGGSYVNQLSIKSGAQLRVSDSSSYEYGRTWKYVQITGPPRAVDRAKKLLHIRLERLSERDGSTKQDPSVDGSPSIQSSSGRRTVDGGVGPTLVVDPVTGIVGGGGGGGGSGGGPGSNGLGSNGLLQSGLPSTELTAEGFETGNI